MTEVAEDSQEPLLATPSFASRILLGILHSIAFVIAIGELTTALLGTTSRNHSVAIPYCAVVIGCVLASAGQKRGSLIGLVVGLLSGALLAFAQRMNRPEIEPPALLGWSAAFPVLGIVAGWLGSKIWPAGEGVAEEQETVVPETTVLQTAPTVPMIPRMVRPHRSLPTHWIRIMLGALLAFSSIVASEAFRTILARSSLGLFNMGGSTNAATIGAQVSVIFLVLGGIISGSNTGSGLRHGFFAALMTLAGLLLATSTQSDLSFRPIAGLCQYLGIPVASVLDPQVGAAVATTVILLVSAGGWLGGQLFPLLSPVKSTRSKFA